MAQILGIAKWIVGVSSLVVCPKLLKLLERAPAPRLHGCKACVNATCSAKSRRPYTGNSMY